MLLLALLYVCVYTMEKDFKSIENMRTCSPDTQQHYKNTNNKTVMNDKKQAHYVYQHSVPVIINVLSKKSKM